MQSGKVAVLYPRFMICVMIGAIMVLESWTNVVTSGCYINFNVIYKFCGKRRLQCPRPSRIKHKVWFQCCICSCVVTFLSTVFMAADW